MTPGAQNVERNLDILGLFCIYYQVIGIEQEINVRDVLQDRHQTGNIQNKQGRRETIALDYATVL